MHMPQKISSCHKNAKYSTSLEEEAITINFEAMSMYMYMHVQCHVHACTMSCTIHMYMHVIGPHVVEIMIM